MLTSMQLRLVALSVLLMVAAVMYPSAPLALVNTVSDETWQSIQFIGPVTIPMMVILMLAAVALVRMAATLDSKQRESFAKRIDFHTGSAVILGTLGTFLGVAMSPALNETALAHAMSSTIVGMSSRLVFRYAVDMVSAGALSLEQ